MDLEKLHSRIDEIQRELDQLQNTLTSCKIEVENEMEKQHLILAHKVENNTKDIALHTKIVFTVIGTVTLGVLYAMLRNIGL